MRSAKIRRTRSGNVLVLTVVMMIVLMGLLALAVDIGYMLVADAELQRTADAAALSAAWELIDERLITGDVDPDQFIGNARASASEFAVLNPVTMDAPALADADIVVGCLASPTDPNAQLTFTDPTQFNAVSVSVHRTENENGKVPFFFGRYFGVDGQCMSASATAAFLNNFVGFQTPSNGGNLQMLPFALDEETWDDLLSGIGTDDWTWNKELGEVQAGADGVLEVNLFPQGTGSPGNRGTVDIGSNNNSTADIARQILDGITPQDLAYHGGSLKLDDYGELGLNGDTGISAGVKDELESIKGEPRIIPIFSDVNGNGNNAQYTIVCFAAIRITEVKLTGKMSNKRVIIQPARMLCQGGIPGGPGASFYVYSPVRLVR